MTDGTTWYMTHSVEVPTWLTPQSLDLDPAPYAVLEMILRTTYHGRHMLARETLAERVHASLSTVKRHVKLLVGRGYVVEVGKPQGKYTPARNLEPQLLVMLRVAVSREQPTLANRHGELAWSRRIVDQLKDQLEHKIKHATDLRTAGSVADIAARLIESHRFDATDATDHVTPLWLALRDAHLILTKAWIMRSRRDGAPVWTPELAAEHLRAYNTATNTPPGDFA